MWWRICAYLVVAVFLIPVLASTQTRGDLDGLIPAGNHTGSVGEVGASYKFDAGFEDKILDIMGTDPADGEYGVHDGTRYYDVVAVVSRDDGDGRDGDETASENKASLVQRLELLGARNIRAAESLSFVTASIPVGEIPGFSLYDEVYAIGDGELPVILEVDTARTTIHATDNDIEKYKDPPPDGSGVVVAVVDRGINNPHINGAVINRTECDLGCGEQQTSLIDGRIVPNPHMHSSLISHSHVDAATHMHLLPNPPNTGHVHTYPGFLSYAHTHDSSHRHSATQPHIHARFGVYDVEHASHGTQVAGVLAASGMAENNGIAGGVSILDATYARDSEDHVNSSRAYHAIDWAYGMGSDVANLSLGLGVCTEYATPSLVVNEAVDKGMVVIKSAGNLGLVYDDEGNAMPNYSSVTNPGCAHNVITVGGINDRNAPIIMSDFASRGPTGDGSNRMVPHIVAPATNIRVLEHVTGDETIPENGTSFAAPQASATAAMMLQLQPELTPAEVKAALLLGAEWMGPVPCTSPQYERNDAADGCSHARQPESFDEANNAESLGILNNAGFGLLNVAESLRYADTGSSYVIHDYLDPATTSREYRFAVRDTSEPAKVILVWMVHPHGGIAEQEMRARTPGFEPPSVANLGFEITSPHGTVWRADSARQTAEFAVFEPHEAGIYRVRVSGSGLDAINKPVQNYALASTHTLSKTPYAPNDPPVADPHTLTVQPGMPKVVRLSASDTNNDAVSFTVSDDPSQGTITAEEFITRGASRAIYTPNEGFAGTDTFEVTPYDGRALGTPATITLQAESLPPGSYEAAAPSGGITYWRIPPPGAMADSRGEWTLDATPSPASGLFLSSVNVEGTEIEFVADGTRYNAAIPPNGERFIRFASPLAISSGTVSYDGIDEEKAGSRAETPGDPLVRAGYALPCTAPSGISGTADSCPVRPDPDPQPEGTVLFHDDFESGIGKWRQTGYGQWHTTISPAHSVPVIKGYNYTNAVAHADGCATKCTLELNSTINLSGYDSGTLSLKRFADSALDSGEYLAVELYDGSKWVTISNWRGTTSDADGEWRSETYDLANYVGIEDFGIRISTLQSDVLEDVQIDDVTVRATGPGPDPPDSSDHSDFTATISADRSVITIRFEGPTSHIFRASDFELSHGTIRSIHNTHSATRTLGVAGVQAGVPLTITYTGGLQSLGTGPGGDDLAIAPDTSAAVSSQSDGARIAAVPGTASSGDTILLDASASTGTGALSYEWVQLRSAAPDVLVRNTDKAVAHFEVPYTTGGSRDVEFRFRVAVTDDIATHDAYIGVGASLTYGGEYVPPVPPDTVHFEETEIFGDQFYSLAEWHAHDEWRTRAPQDPLPADTNGRVAQIDECGDSAGCDMVLRDHFWLNPNHDEVGMLMYVWFGDEITDRDGLGTDIRMQFNTNTGPWHEVADVRVLDSPHERWFYVEGDLSDHRGKYVGMRISPSLESDDSLIQVDGFRVVGRTADRTPPAFDAAPANVTAEAGSHAGTSVYYPVPNATDAVSGAADVACWPRPGTVFDLGRTEVNCTAADASGNAATASFHVIVQDTTPPEVVAPPDFEMESPVLPATIPSARLGTANVTDLADPDPAVSYHPQGPFDEGTTEVVWTATDASGNSATAVQRVTVLHADAASIKAPPDISLEATAPLTPVPKITLGEANVTGAGPSPDISHDPQGPFPVGVTEVVWTVSGTSGNASDVQLVTIQDTTPPSVTAPPDIVIESNMTSTTIPESRLGTAIAADLADPAPAVSHDSSGTFPQGTTTVTWTATDSSGNSGAAYQNVTIQEASRHRVDPPPDLTIQATAQLTPVSDGMLGNATATGPDPEITHDSPGAFPLGTTDVTWTAVWPGGHTATAVQQVTMNATAGMDPGIILHEDFASGLGSWFVEYRGDWDEPFLPNHPPGTYYNNLVRSSDCDYICAMTLAHPVDLSGYGSATLLLDRYLAWQLDPKERLAIQMYNGSAWGLVAEWGASGGHADSRWHSEAILIDPEYLVPDASVRLFVRSSHPNEVVMVDNISIVEGDVRVLAAEADGIRVSSDPENHRFLVEWDPIPGHGDYILQRSSPNVYDTVLNTTGTEAQVPTHVGDYGREHSFRLAKYEGDSIYPGTLAGPVDIRLRVLPSSLYSVLPISDGFDSGLDGWHHREFAATTTIVSKCGYDTTLMGSLEHSDEYGGSALVDGGDTCGFGSAGIRKGFIPPPVRGGYWLHYSFDYRIVSDGAPIPGRPDIVISTVSASNGGTFPDGTFRQYVNTNDTGWATATKTLKLWDRAWCPCALNISLLNALSRQNFDMYVDNVSIRLVPAVAGASGAPVTHGMLSEDEFFRMLFSYGSKVLITDKVPYDSAISLEWEPLGNATEYDVSIRPASGPDGMLSEDVTGTQHTFVGLAPDTEYVVVVGVAGDGSTQSTLHARTWPAGTVPFDAGLEIEAYFDGPVVSVSWTDSNGIGNNRYTLERSVSGGPYEPVYSGTGTSHSDFITPDMFASNASYRVLEHVGGQVLYSDAVRVAIP